MTLAQTLPQAVPDTDDARWQPPEQGGVKRVGVIDIGSNSVRLVVFDGLSRSPAYFFNEKILCGLGKNIHETGILDPEGRDRALAALHRFVELAHLLQVSRLNAIATAAVRVASDGPKFCKQVQRETGLNIHVASGEEEAQLAAKGVLLGWPHANGLVCDMGGASMELAEMTDGAIGLRQTSPLGPLQLANITDSKDVSREIKRGIKALYEAVPGKAKKLILVGGSWRAIAKLDMVRRKYPLHVLHEYAMTPEQVSQTRRFMKRFSITELSAMTETSTDRLELVPLAAQVLSELLKIFETPTLTVSSYGLREGMLYDLMPTGLRERDPLIETARQMEQSRARFPGFGDVLFKWIKPLIKGRSEAELRLAYAACLLHDIGWRSHPDYRAEVCFETITRANLSGLDHPGRVFLGLTVLHRYRGAAGRDFDPAILTLLPEDRQQEAETLGRALRLGSMLTGSAPGALEDTSLTLDDTELTLSLSGVAVKLCGEKVDQRLASLAARLGRQPRLIVAD